jgi:hypothetical protein
MEKEDILNYYKRSDIKKVLTEYSMNREVSSRFGDMFGKRPDTLAYENDVDFLAKQGATSFHVSEEIWIDPLRIKTGMKKKELDDLRLGWDLILDVDCKDWNWSKKITHKLILELKNHGIKSTSCKFSGNKGFHIAVPWECFEKSVAEKKTSDLFPELPRQILNYLVNGILKETIASEIENDYEQVKQICESFKITPNQLFIKCCKNCEKELVFETKKIICPKCQSEDVKIKGEWATCNKCKDFFENENIGIGGKQKYKICECKNDVNKEENQKTRTEIKYILDVDAILIAPRHLYRMVYSLHEKSGLASVPVDIDKVLEFKKEFAKIENITVKKDFLKYIEKDSAKELCKKAIEFNNLLNSEKEKKLKQKFDKIKKTGDQNEENEKREFEFQKIALPIDYFPPCMNIIKQGLKDGKKRAMFCYVAFLFNIGWSYEEVEKEIYEWNKKNGEEGLRENSLIAHLMSYKRNPERIQMLPPNCDNKAYYVDLNLCHPDGLCRTIKNPVQYTKEKDWLKNREIQKKKKEEEEKLNEKQLLMRKEYRTFPTYLKKLREFVQKNQSLPKKDAKTKLEQELHSWIERQKEKFNENSLNEIQIKTLKELDAI